MGRCQNLELSLIWCGEWPNCYVSAGKVNLWKIPRNTDLLLKRQDKPAHQLGFTVLERLGPAGVLGTGSELRCV